MMSGSVKNTPTPTLPRQGGESAAAHAANADPSISSLTSPNEALSPSPVEGEGE